MYTAVHTMIKLLNYDCCALIYQFCYLKHVYILFKTAELKSSNIVADCSSRLLL